MDFESYCFLGVGVAISVIGFFLKREAQKTKCIEDKVRNLEVALARNSARDEERWGTNSKVLEDRRQDVQKLFDMVNRK